MNLHQKSFFKQNISQVPAHWAMCNVYSIFNLLLCTLCYCCGGSFALASSQVPWRHSDTILISTEALVPIDGNFSFIVKYKIETEREIIIIDTLFQILKLWIFPSIRVLFINWRSADVCISLRMIYIK